MIHGNLSDRRIKRDTSHMQVNLNHGEQCSIYIYIYKSATSQQVTLVSTFSARVEVIGFSDIHKCWNC